MNEVVKKEQQAAPGIFAFTLKPGEWKSLFNVPQRKLLIARALNATTDEHEFKHCIAGYLISSTGISLVLYIEQKKITRMFDRFKEKIRDGIRNSLDDHGKKELKNILKEEHISREELFEDIFEPFPLKNEHLVKLITGRKVELPYYDPELQRLKDKVRDSKYCSVLDYEGGESPVRVTVLKEKEWEAHQTTMAK